MITKSTTKLIVSMATAAAIFFSVNAKAQTLDASKFRFGIGLETGVPTGDSHDYSKFVLGGTARLQYGLSDKLALTFTTGYYNYFVKNSSYTYTAPYPDITLKARDLGVIPVKIGVKAFFAPGFYFSGETGAAFAVHPIFVNGGLNTNLVLSPGIGYASKSLDVGSRYEDFTNGNAVTESSVCG